ncbi:stage II sporulation protein R [Lentibacillus sp. CBA3610]|uniref:stage II sporulation protein R n=1 Tax=Lentibacillus sp. CBA3610 TaxID=2518176 RepID=UPI001596177B|nr:stage II sporulation protein R [Lentibacillus sp. CBA3610]QKY70488.1 stage II sporulation protein R [Lentibacillus sp. CBA3610]
MRKLAVSAIIIFIIIFAMPVKSISEENGYSAQSDIKVIPDEAIRLRILANSDSEEDQALKRKVRDEVNNAITEWVEHMTDIDEARKLIESRIPEINTIVNDVLEAENNQQDANVEYGKNVTFPAKLYGSYMYPPGEYEAVLITLGEGQGDNWWCVLFPPLCFLDFSNGASVAEAEEAETDEETQDEDKDEEEEAEVKFFLFEWFS